MASMKIIGNKHLINASGHFHSSCNGEGERLLSSSLLPGYTQLVLRSQAVTIQIQIYSKCDITQSLQSLQDGPEGRTFYWLKLGDKASLILKRVVEKVIRIKGPIRC